MNHNARKCKEYEKARNALIPEAVAYADEIAGDKPTGPENDRTVEAWSTLWNVTFFRMMDHLARKAGLMT